MFPNPHIVCLIEAAHELQIPYETFDRNGNLVKIANVYFANHMAPLNSEDVAYIARDKEFTYFILKDDVRMPKTVGYLDPNTPEEYRKYARFSSVEEIASDIESNFKYPLIVKRNSGARGMNVFVCENKAEVIEKLQKIFNRDSREYDYVALAQEKVNSVSEYRAVMIDGKLELLYRKDNSEATYDGNVSPLHWKNAKAVDIEDGELVKKIQEFADPIFKKIHLRWGGLDIAVDREGGFWLFELNSHPGFTHYMKDNGREKIVELYKKLLKSLKK